MAETFGNDLFSGAVANAYLRNVALDPNTLKTPAWTRNPATIEKVAAAVLMWAQDQKADSYCQWFQPLAGAGARHGQSAQVQNTMMKVDRRGQWEWHFTGAMLMRGETDGSSFPNGGLRETCRAAAYLVLDPSSPIFIRHGVVHIPACMCSHDGHALDEKTPLLRSVDALSREGARLLNLLGIPTNQVVPNIGLEQEFFLVTAEAYRKRPDLQQTGRTLFGHVATRGQDGEDHYMAPLAAGSKALACTRQVQRECFKVGIPLRTKHREVAPGQFEFAPLYGTTVQQVDQNVLVMQILDEVAKEHGLVALLHEKPFEGVNGSGKHNNWSLAVAEGGTNLFNYGQLREQYGEVGEAAFPVILAAVLEGVKSHGDLMRISVATPGNDFRLGACEAPPAIMTAYLGNDLTSYLGKYVVHGAGAYEPSTRTVDLGAAAIAPFVVPAEDRNRTSPFPFGGHRFEFRAVGSSQNVSFVNTVLNTITANAFAAFAERIEGGASPRSVACASLATSMAVVFNGDGYSTENQHALIARGLPCADSGVDAIAELTAGKNAALFAKHRVLNPEELAARREVMLQEYIAVVRVEAATMVNIFEKYVAPTSTSLPPVKKKLFQMATTIREALTLIWDPRLSTLAQAQLCRRLRLHDMPAFRTSVDSLESHVPASEWPLATYEELFFMDSTV